MKKRIGMGFFFILLGFSIAKILFTSFSIPKINKKGDKYYFLQEGIYYQKEKLNDIKQKIVEYHGNKIIVYAGITKDLEVAEKLINLYDDNNIRLSIKEKYLKNEELKNNIEQFDLLIKESKDSYEILKIEEVVLANYEEIIKSRDS